MRRASVFLYLSASHEMRRKGFASSGILHSRSCFTWFATASPDRTAPRSRDGAKEIRVSVRMPAYRDRSLDRTTHRAVTAEFPELRLGRERDRERLCYSSPAWATDSTVPVKGDHNSERCAAASGEVGPSPLPLSRSRSQSARALSASLLLHLSPVSSSSKEPPAGTSTASGIAHQMARTLVYACTTIRYRWQDRIYVSIRYYQMEKIQAYL